MQQIIQTTAAQMSALPAGSGLVRPIERKMLEQHAPSAHFALIRDGGLSARCSIWTEGTPPYKNERLGFVGHYAAEDQDSGVGVLNHALDQVARNGCTMAVGPMDGNTWRRYRFVTQRGSEPAFFLEPDNPDDWPSHFEAAGFAPLARYSSSLNEDLSVMDPRVPEALARMRDAGVVIRNIELNRLEEELRAVHELSVEAFANNFLYSPISQVEFVAMYQVLRPHLRAELVLLAEQHGKLTGFMFGLPNMNEAMRGEPIRTAVAKSLAVRPGRTGAGLGSILMEQFQQSARTLGYGRVIHALMHEDNRSNRISYRFGRMMRQYTLYSKALAP